MSINLEALAAEKQELEEELDTLKEMYEEHEPEDIPWRDEERMDELKELLAPIKELFDTIEEYGGTDSLIGEEEFRDHVEYMANDIETIPEHWPYNCIDWDKAAELLKQDYIEVSYMGVTYYFMGG